MFRVVTLRRKPWPDWFVYVGRPWAGLEGSELGNPFTGPAAVARFREWLAGHPKRDAMLWRVLGDSEGGRFPLACWCGDWEPGQTAIECHAVAIAQALIERFGNSIREDV
jgi:hypothetical protein